jgi:hypothetical protein
MLLAFYLNLSSLLQKGGTLPSFTFIIMLLLFFIIASYFGFTNGKVIS